MTRREAGEYLRWPVAEVDQNLVPLDNNPAPVHGRMRYLVMDIEGVERVRILAGDVFSILPLPPIPDRSSPEPVRTHPPQQPSNLARA
jgi:hypothetical protein